MEVFIFFSLFISTALIVLFISNKKNKKAQEEILNYLEKTIIIKIIGVSCSVVYLGFNNRSLNFKHCDLYISKDSFLIIDNDFGQKGKPKLIVKKTNNYNRLSKSVIICKLGEVTYIEQELNIVFFNSNLSDSPIRLIAENISRVNKEKINTLIKEINW